MGLSEEGIFIFLLSVFVKTFVSKVFPLLSSTLLKKCAQMQLIGQKVMSRQLWCSFEAQKHPLLLYFSLGGGGGGRNNKKIEVHIFPKP